MPNFTLIRREIAIVVAFVGLGAVATLSCSQSAEGESQVGGSSNTSGGAGNRSHGGAATGGVGHAGGVSATGGLPDLAVSDGGALEGDAGASAVCSAEVREGQRVPIDMYFLVDSSGSMGDSVSGGGSKWDTVSSALTGFLEDPRNADTGVGIGYFPIVPSSCTKGQPGCFCIPLINLCFVTEGGSCDVSDYATPAVKLALPSQPAAVVSDINGHEIGGGTPTRPALEGALQYLSEWANQHPERKPLLVLATDGEPVGCEPNTPQDVADVAARALAGPNAIRTFVIGVGSSLVSLNLVAQAGGTDHAFLVDTGGDVAKEFGDALDQIRGTASSCDFSIPDASAGTGSIDPTKVNVSYVRSGSSTPAQVPQTFMGDPKNCDASGGWYYDDPKSPKVIKLCDATCRSLNAGSIQVEFGCDTVEQPPPR
ncbi:MAG TPA: vWA domain-containing protein [Polyangiaceae bacterium]|nr:vWA domain-containing protein [Polyangiaceae bacterium]